MTILKSSNFTDEYVNPISQSTFTIALFRLASLLSFVVSDHQSIEQQVAAISNHGLFHLTLFYSFKVLIILFHYAICRFIVLDKIIDYFGCLGQMR